MDSICPYTKRRYSGLCIYSECQAHLGSPDKHPSGCVHSLLGFKEQLTVYDLAYAFDRPANQVRRDYGIGVEQLKSLMRFDEMLNQVRLEKQSEQRFCTKCMVSRSSGGDCLNVKKCQRRVRRLDAVMSQIPFSIKTFRVDRREVWRLIAWAKKYEKLEQLYAMCPTIEKLGTKTTV